MAQQTQRAVNSMNADGGCPPEDVLAAFIERRLGQPEIFEAHLDNCASCRMLVANLAAVIVAQQSMIHSKIPATQEAAVANTVTSPAASAVAGAGGFAEGDKVARYVIERELGRGGMGVVFVAFDPALHRKVALKVVRPEIDDPSARERILREARAMARLSHPNVVTIHDVGELPDGQVFLAMELVEGSTLRRLLVEPRSLDGTLDLFIQAARGLAAAHDAGLVHRDFKPDNVLLGRDGRVRVTDFGLVSGAAEQQHSTGTLVSGRALTATGSVLGTPAYMAPEQHIGLPANAKADQFAFAVALYEVLTRQRPFQGKTYDEIRSAKLSHSQWPLVPSMPGLPEALRVAIDRALARDPDHRHAGMNELIAILEESRRAPQPAVAPPVVPVVHPPPVPVPPPPRLALSGRPVAGGSNGWMIYVGVALVVVFGIGLIVVAVTVMATVTSRSSKTSKTTDPVPTRQPEGMGPSGASNAVGVSSTPTPVPSFVPVVPNPTMQSVFPCPSGTRLDRNTSLHWLACKDSSGGLEGPSLWFHKSNGKLRLHQTYANQKQTGREWAFDDSGRLTRIEDMFDGKPDGLRIELHMNGRTRTEHPYRRGVEHGLWRRWSSDGKLESWQRYENGTIADKGTF